MNTYCCFQVRHRPDAYLDRERIERIWRGLLDEERPEDGISMHLCPMHMMHGNRSVGSSFFLVPGRHVWEAGRAAPDDPPAPHGGRIYNRWELEEPNPMPHLSLTCTPVPERPSWAAGALGAAIGEGLSWHVPNIASFFSHCDQLVLIPVDLDFRPTPRKAALAWEWFEAFLERAHAVHSPLPDGHVEIHGSSYFFRHRPIPEHYKVERLMSLFSKIECFYAPPGESACPQCGAALAPDDLWDVLAAGGEFTASKDFLCAAPCCGREMGFNEFTLDWLGFARFALQSLAVACGKEDLEELGRIMEAPFKAIYTHV